MTVVGIGFNNALEDNLSLSNASTLVGRFEFLAEFLFNLYWNKASPRSQAILSLSVSAPALQQSISLQHSSEPASSSRSHSLRSSRCRRLLGRFRGFAFKGLTALKGFIFTPVGTTTRAATGFAENDNTTFSGV